LPALPSPHQFVITLPNNMPATLKWIAATLFVLLTLIVSAETLHAQRKIKNGIDEKRLAELSVRMKSFVDDGRMAGGVMLVSRGGQIAKLEAFGYQDVDAKKPMQVDTIFDIRSVTKTITAIGIMILVEDGRLSLGDPIEQHIPEFKRANPGAFGPIRIRHLLTHTGGLPLYRLPESQDIAVKRNRTLVEYVGFLSKQVPEWEPGSKFRYSSGGFAILGRIIEVASGKTYEQFIKERIFDPLGMKDSFFFVPAGKQNRVAAIYRILDGRLTRWREIEAHNRESKYSAPEFGMYSTVTDLGALAHMILNRGSLNGTRILSGTSVDTMVQNHTLNIENAVTQKPAYQGLGWGLAGDPMADFPLTTPGSFGHNGAFGAILWIDPRTKLVRIFLEHRFGFNNESNIFMAMAGAAVLD
jgi:CubicO group peptidase (beta-lactamase class C family)